jgi:hypothetical protein
MALNVFNLPLTPNQPTPVIRFADSTPTETGLNLGDIIINTACGPGEAIGWICTDPASPSFTPIAVGGLTGPVQAKTAAGTITDFPGIVTVSGFAGNLTLASPTVFSGGFQQAILALTTHSVTLVAPSGASIVGLNAAITSNTAAAKVVPVGTIWYRLQ